MDDVYRAIADPTRRAILDRLAVEECSVTQLTDAFPITQQAVSQHLGRLRQARLITSRRVARQRRYRLRPAPLRGVMRWLDRYRRFIDPSGHHWALSAASGRPRGFRKGDT
jgi:DNA-binding transcriptional ArsR family regulator